jgi:hypothetical protein
MISKRRLLGSALAGSAALLSSPALAGILLSFHQGNGALPSGVTLQAIDGETMLTSTTMSHNYYGRNGFSVAASSAYNGISWDDPAFFPILNDYATYNQSNIKIGNVMKDLGINGSIRCNGSAGDNTSIKNITAAGLFALQAPHTGFIEGGTPNAATSGFNIDEPQSATDIQTPITNAGSALTGRFMHVNFMGFNFIFNSLGGQTLAQVLANAYTNPNGGTYFVSMISADFYFFSCSNDTAPAQLNNVAYLYGVTAPATFDQAARGSNYGDYLDAFRVIQRTLAPTATYIENVNTLLSDAGTRAIMAKEWNWAVWSTIVHGARWLLFFGGTAGNVGFNFNQMGFAPSIISGEAISLYDQAKVTNALVTNVARILNSPFALGYATVTPLGYAFPTRVARGDPSDPRNFSFGSNGIEIMAKSYQDGSFTPSSGPLKGYTVGNGFYIFTCVRGSPSQTNIAANFTIANTGSSSVTVLNDAMFYATLSGSTLRVTEVGGGSKLRVGQTIYLNGTNFGTISAQTSGTTGSTGTYTLTGSGTVARATYGVGMRNITLSGGALFSDTFETSYTSRIYRVN